MIDKIHDTEIKYIKSFTNSEELQNRIRFTDDNIKDMYSHNFIYINEDVGEGDMLSLIAEEIDHRRKQGKGFLRVVTSCNVTSDLLDKLPLKPEVEVYDYLGTKTDRYTGLKEKKNSRVLVADNISICEDGRIVDIVANYVQMTLEFAIRRIDRKMMVYTDNNRPVNLYVCYDGIEPVGNCELMINGNIAKIEDFDIIEMHRRKGFGSHVLRNLLKSCSEKGVENAYLKTDHDDTAKEMYFKCGFEQVGQSTELMFNIK